MKIKRTPGRAFDISTRLTVLTLLALSTLSSQLSTVLAQGTAFTYQGRLNENAGPATGLYDLRFTIYDSLASGSAVGGPVTNATTSVTNGLFAVTLDVGAGVFTGADRWLEVGVRTNGSSGAYQALTPRQQISAAPYAIRAANATTYTGAVSDSQVPPNVARRDQDNTFTGNNAFTGPVGIGTNSPAYKLDVNNDTIRVFRPAGPAYVRIEGISGSSIVDFGDGSTLGAISTWSLGRYNSDNSFRLAYNTDIVGANDKLVVKTDGNVGLGTNNPQSTLHVNGTVTAGSFSGSGAGLTLLAAANLSGTVPDARLSANVPLLNGNQTFTANNSFSGPVGIGTTSPGAKLHVDGGNSGVAIYAYDVTGEAIVGDSWTGRALDGYSGNTGIAVHGYSQAGTAVMGESPSGAAGVFLGNVGIGTTTPSRPLDIYDPNSGPSQLRLAALHGNLGIEFVTTTPTVYNWRIGAQNIVGDGFEITPSTTVGGTSFSSPAVTVLYNGNVGIGRVSPQSKLELSSGFDTEVIRFGHSETDFHWISTGFHGTQPQLNYLGFGVEHGSSDTRRVMTLQGDGNVGIGTNSPQYPLHVVGKIVSGVDTTAAGLYATMGGGWYNSASSDGATVSGGVHNTASGGGATVGGGFQNTASGDSAGVGGGFQNTASGNFATVGGGISNAASGQLSAVVGGGFYNTASGGSSMVGGGDFNTASGYRATVPGGGGNTASGAYSFAAGNRAKSIHDGSFILTDSNDFDFVSGGPNGFAGRFTGGVSFFSAINGSGGVTAGVQLFSGSSSWSSYCDRNMKENFQPVDTGAVLKKLVEMPLTEWNFKAQSESIRHIGPVAQDFRQAFRLGEDETHISTVDADGVAFAAIQGLNQKVESETAALRAELKRRETENEELKQTLNELKQVVKAMNQKLADQTPKNRLKP